MAMAANPHVSFRFLRHTSLHIVLNRGILRNSRYYCKLIICDCHGHSRHTVLLRESGGAVGMIYKVLAIHPVMFLFDKTQTVSEDAHRLA